MTDSMNIDDVCAVFSVHGSAGVIGALLVGVPVLTVPDAGVRFTSQLVGVVVIAGWTVLTTALVFGALKAIGQIRVSRTHEHDGLDISRCCEPYRRQGGRKRACSRGPVRAGPTQFGRIQTS